MKIYTNPEYANTNSLLTSVGITPEMGQPFVEAFNQFHIKPEEDITKSKLYEKISNIFTTKESIPTIQKINMTFEDATKNVAAMQKFVSLYVNKQDNSLEKLVNAYQWLEEFYYFIYCSLNEQKIR